MKNITNAIAAILLLVLAGGTFRAFAQSAAFVVYDVTGKVYKINTPQHTPVKKGEHLSASDWLSIPKNAQVLLVCQGGQCLRLYKADTLRLSGLTASCKPDSHSFAAAFFTYIWNSATGKADDRDNDETNNGVIVRGNGYLGGLNVSLDSINYLSGPVKIKWQNKKLVNVRFYKHAKDSEPFKEFDVKTNVISLDSMAAALQNPGIYYWSVNTVSNQNAPVHYLKLWAQPQYTLAVNRILKMVVKTEPAQTAFMSGFLLQKAGFLAEAAKYYARAVNLNPNNKIYKTFNAKFL